MNDNTPDDAADLPDWTWDIVEQHDLGLRADSPRAAVTVLLADAADALKELYLITFREQAVTPSTREAIAACAGRLADALKLAPLCPGAPSAGVVTEASDGTLQWAPVGAEEEA